MHLPSTLPGRLPLLASILLCSAAAGRAADLPRSTPEEQGVSSTALREFVERADRDGGGFHSLMVVRHGHVIAEGWWTPYSADRRHELYSLSKSFTSTAVGLAVAEGRIQLDDPVLKFFPNEAPAEPSANLRAMRIRDLLRMATGHQDEPPSGAANISTASFLSHPVPHKPGTHFKYNTPATFMLSAIVQHQTGQTVLEYLTPRLFEPLGIDSPAWGTNAQGINLGGWGLRIRTGDIARFGQMLLQHGRWEGRQLLPADWVTEATSLRVANGSNPDSDWDQGYGYQFWQCRHGAYRGDGAFGQYCIVLPSQDTVIAFTAGSRDMQGMLNLVWDHLLPSLGPEPLPASPAAHRALAGTLSRLEIPRPKAGTGGIPGPGIAGRRFTFPPNDSGIRALTVAADGTGQATLVTIESDAHRAQVTCSPDTWSPGTGPLGPVTETALSTTGAWTDENTFVARICAVETPHLMTLTLRFAPGEVTCDTEFNVAFGSRKAPSLKGVAE